MILVIVESSYASDIETNIIYAQRKKDPAEISEEEAVLELYRAALGM